MAKCIVRDCPHKQGKDRVRFFCFPTAIRNQCAKTRNLSQRRRAEWIARINREDFSEKSINRRTRVCGNHFVKGFPCGLFDTSNQDWAPSCNLGYEYLHKLQIDSAGPMSEEMPSPNENLKPLTENTSSNFCEDVCMDGCNSESSDIDSSEGSSQVNAQTDSNVEALEHSLVENSTKKDTLIYDCKVEPIEHIVVESCVEGGDDCKEKPTEHNVVEDSVLKSALMGGRSVKPFEVVMVEGSSQQDVSLGDCKVEIEHNIVEDLAQEDTLIGDCKVEPFEHIVVEDSSQEDTLMDDCNVEPFEHIVVEESLQEYNSVNVYEQAPHDCAIGVSSLQNSIRFGDREEVLDHVTTGLVCESSGLTIKNGVDLMNISVNREIAEKLSLLGKHTMRFNECVKTYVNKPHYKKTSVGSCTHCSKLQNEVQALLGELNAVKSGLSESLVEKNLTLAAKNLKIKELEKKIKNLEKGNLSFLKTFSVAHYCFSEESFQGDNNKVRYFTGLPSFQVLINVFNVFSKRVKDSSAYVLSKFQQFIMVLMWLRLGLEEQDLAYRFGVCQSTASKVLHRWLLPMSSSFDEFVVLPDRETFQSSMPQWFKTKLNKAALLLIDCFKVSIKSPGQSKVHKSIKFLIATSPQKQILFASNAWAASFKDKHITENCGLLDRLLPGDIVMADGGFGDSDDVGMSAKEVVQAPDGRKQLSSHAFIGHFTNVDFQAHVDSGVHQYKILGSNLSYEFLSTMSGSKRNTSEHIVRVCCVLMNVSPIAQHLINNKNSQLSQACP